MQTSPLNVEFCAINSFVYLFWKCEKLIWLYRELNRTPTPHVWWTYLTWILSIAKFSKPILYRTSFNSAIARDLFYFASFHFLSLYMSPSFLKILPGMCHWLIKTLYKFYFLQFFLSIAMALHSNSIYIAHRIFWKQKSRSDENIKRRMQEIFIASVFWHAPMNHYRAKQWKHYIVKSGMECISQLIPLKPDSCCTFSHFLQKTLTETDNPASFNVKLYHFLQYVLLFNFDTSRKVF